jgi:hypothetical protein
VEQLLAVDALVIGGRDGKREANFGEGAIRPVQGEIDAVHFEQRAVRRGKPQRAIDFVVAGGCLHAGSEMLAG